MKRHIHMRKFCGVKNGDHFSQHRIKMSFAQNGRNIPAQGKIVFERRPGKRAKNMGCPEGQRRDFCSGKQGFERNLVPLNDRLRSLSAL